GLAQLGQMCCDSTKPLVETGLAKHSFPPCGCGLLRIPQYAARREAMSHVKNPPLMSPGGRGGTRLPQPVERVITQAIEGVYLTRQKRRVEAVVFEVRKQCRRLGLKPPAANTVRARVRAVRPEMARQRREGAAAAQPLLAAPGSTPEAGAPFEVFQMDHT